MKKIKSLLLLTFIIGSITSCGYQLRGSINIEGLQNINIIANNYGITRILEQKAITVSAR
jgi:outer membrane lipopolysaccharide assembly protein LptE/RlpB